jgi:hypothetical protein
VEHRVPGGLDPVDEPHRVHDDRVVGAAIDSGDLECADEHPPALRRPDRGRVVDVVAGGGDLDLELHPHRLAFEPLPNLCNAGALGQCPADTATADAPPADPAAADLAARTQAAASADAFLNQWVPRIRKSAAFKKDGLLIITFGEAQPPEGAAEPTQVGALLLSPLAPAGATVGTPYDPYSLLRSTQDLFGLSPLANADAKGTESFASQLTGGGD